MEEEFLLVDARTVSHAPVAEQLLDSYLSGASATQLDPSSRRNLHPGTVPPGNKSARNKPAGNSLKTEVQREQVEAVSAPFTQLRDLATAIRAGRTEADRQALALGARAVALGTSPLSELPHPTGQERYLAMRERFGLIHREQLTCGFHVHVSVASDEEGVAVLDRIRIWLPILIALSANSPFWQGKDTGYASFRYQVWRRLPTAGPTEIFGSAKAYRDLLAMLLSCDVLLDAAMIYFDARLSSTYPTVEIRVPDVCMDANHAVALAAIIRALVETAARQWDAGEPPAPVPAEMLRLASWRASRFALADSLIHPLENRPRPAKACVSALMDHVRPVLTETGDLARVGKHSSTFLPRAPAPSIKETFCAAEVTSGTLFLMPYSALVPVLSSIRWTFDLAATGCVDTHSARASFYGFCGTARTECGGVVVRGMYRRP
ncbi:glutamate--cysteine ligase [Paenarthrobacter sp. PH39-S1]|uniref:carboxylate-amine ligase n=1 Tax=Paenarthrobacter sp. PH39-S1 TaxID=3046204 RepID=UPI0024BBB57A|nr:glutamate--cysteine ligase [Paenarthrobacter sp. PH39-S1]MDJ0356292.1 glutamate--cysteine ligase [Paenarthrobacter sp. PH39-S1]